MKLSLARHAAPLAPQTWGERPAGQASASFASPKIGGRGADSRPIFALLIAILTVIMTTSVASAQTSPLHPTFPLLDQNGENVLDSGQPVSTMETCGTCHDTDFIADHSFHTSVGLDDLGAPGSLEGSRPWEMSPGLFGAWDPLTYRTLSPAGDEIIDLGTPDWIKLFGERHVGGGPALVSRSGEALSELPIEAGDPETHSVDPETGELTPWDWTKSGGVEMNCFLCHMPDPNNEARVESLQSGEFGWANTATLLGTGIVEQSGDGWTWIEDAFQADGELAAEHITIQSPTPENCGACHGVVHQSSEPLLPADISASDAHTQRTGQIFSGQRLKDSGLNLADKDDLTRPWDVHAERNVQCSDCHFSVNNPIYYQEPADSRPEHLDFDPRRMDFGDYLQRPDHNFARGQAAQSVVAPIYQDAMRRCDSCHNTDTTHDWLPYTDLHMETLSCESCHIPQIHAPAIQQIDWTVITPAGEAAVTHRGVDGPVDDVRSLITGYQPALLSQQDVDGNSQLTPANLITTHYWVHGDPERPVRVEELSATYLDGDSYRAEILAEFDANGDGELGVDELRLDSDTKVELVRSLLIAQGLSDPRIRGDIDSYVINHDVATGQNAVSECATCHSEDSRIGAPFALAGYLPGDVEPAFRGDNADFDSDLAIDDDGVLNFNLNTAAMGLYIPGHDRVDWVGTVGLLMLLGTIAVVVVHGGLRIIQDARHAKDPHEAPQMQSVYMYSMYERAWHWLQAITIMMLLATGIVIHRPDTLGGIDFGLAVPLHNVLAFILVVNAVFSVFYHFASGEIRQYLPEPRGYFSQMMMQADYYVRGIFSDAPHPFEKTRQRKLNPLQQATYFGILNVLLPLQMFTGILMWGVLRWPEVVARMGGLPWLAPFHTLIAWAFAAFLVAHIYLTTTGHTPTANIKAMTIGWDEVEVGDGSTPSGEQAKA